MINVWCVRVGDKYTEDNVDALAHMVKKNLRRDFHFRVIRESDKPGWWAKIDLHKHAEPGPNLYLDLDVIIVGDITPIVEWYGNSWLAMPKNWSVSGHGGFQSSVMCWGGDSKIIHDDFDKSKIGEIIGPENCRNCGTYCDEGQSFWGDQEWVSWKYGRFIKEIHPGEIISYKYHCRNELPESAKIVCFHGKPDYWECNDEWIKQALS